MSVIQFIGETYSSTPIKNGRTVTEIHDINRIRIDLLNYIVYNSNTSEYIYCKKSSPSTTPTKTPLDVERVLTGTQNLLSTDDNTGSIQFNYESSTSKTISIDSSAINKFSVIGTKLVYSYSYMLPRTEVELPDSGDNESGSSESGSGDNESGSSESVNVVGDAAVKLIAERFTQFRIAKNYTSNEFKIDEFTEFVDHLTNEAAKLQAKYNMLNGELDGLKRDSIKAKWVAKNVTVEVLEEDNT